MRLQDLVNAMRRWNGKVDILFPYIKEDGTTGYEAFEQINISTAWLIMSSNWDNINHWEFVLDTLVITLED